MKISPSDRVKKTMPVSVRLSPASNKVLTKIATAMDRPKSWLIEQAINDYVELQKWQIAAIEEGIRQADAGMGIPHEKVEKWVKSWDTPDELPMPKSHPKTKLKPK